MCTESWVCESELTEVWAADRHLKPWGGTFARLLVFFLVTLQFGFASLVSEVHLSYLHFRFLSKQTGRYMLGPIL